MCMTVEMCVRMYECLQRPGENVGSSMVVLQVVANGLMRVLGIELRSSGITMCILSAGPSCQLLNGSFKSVIAFHFQKHGRGATVGRQTESNRRKEF